MGKKKKRKVQPDLNTLFAQVQNFSDQYRFHLSQLSENSWQAKFERIDTMELWGDVSAKGETVVKAVELALVLVSSQPETGKNDDG